MWKLATIDVVDRLCLPDADNDAVTGLKFSEALPQRLAIATLAARLAPLSKTTRAVGGQGPDGAFEVDEDGGV